MNTDKYADLIDEFDGYLDITKRKRNLAKKRGSEWMEKKLDREIQRINRKREVYYDKLVRGNGRG